MSSPVPLSHERWRVITREDRRESLRTGEIDLGKDITTGGHTRQDHLRSQDGGERKKRGALMEVRKCLGLYSCFSEFFGT